MAAEQRWREEGEGEGVGVIGRGQEKGVTTDKENKN